MQKRVWRTLEEFPKYQISDRGEIVNDTSDRPVTLTRNQQGILRVGLVIDGRGQHSRSVARLVANTFLPGRTDIFDTPIHLDGDRTNCELVNLMWRPRWFAIKYHQQFSIPVFHTAHPILYLIEEDEVFYDIKTPCIKYGLIWADVLKSRDEETFVWPTGQNFRHHHE